MPDPVEMTNIPKDGNESQSHPKESRLVSHRSSDPMTQSSKSLNEPEPPTDIPTLPKRYRNRNNHFAVRRLTSPAPAPGLDEHVFPYRRSTRLQKANQNEVKTTFHSKADLVGTGDAPIMVTADKSSEKNETKLHSTLCHLSSTKHDGSTEVSPNLGLPSQRTGLRSVPVHRVSCKRMQSDRDTTSDVLFKRETSSHPSTEERTNTKTGITGKESKMRRTGCKDNERQRKVDISAEQKSSVERKQFGGNRDSFSKQEATKEERSILTRNESQKQSPLYKSGRGLVEVDVVESDVQSRKRRRVSFSQIQTAIIDQTNKSGKQSYEGSVAVQKLKGDYSHREPLQVGTRPTLKSADEKCPPSDQVKVGNSCSSVEIQNVSADTESSDEPSRIRLSPVKRHEDFSNEQARLEYFTARNEKLEAVRQRMMIIRRKRRRKAQREQRKKMEERKSPDFSTSDDKTRVLRKKHLKDPTTLVPLSCLRKQSDGHDGRLLSGSFENCAHVHLDEEITPTVNPTESGRLKAAKNIPVTEYYDPESKYRPRYEPCRPLNMKGRSKEVRDSKKAASFGLVKLGGESANVTTLRGLPNLRRGKITTTNIIRHHHRRQRDKAKVQLDDSEEDGDDDHESNNMQGDAAGEKVVQNDDHNENQDAGGDHPIPRKRHRGH